MQAAPGLKFNDAGIRTGTSGGRWVWQPAPGDNGMSSQDLDLRCGIRNALTRHWIDLTKTAFFVRRGHVQLTGEVIVVGAQRPLEDIAGALKAFESDVRRLQEVKSLSFEFTNWVRDDSGKWTCLAKGKSADPSPATGDREAGEAADSY